MKKNIILFALLVVGNVFGQDHLLQNIPQVKSPDTYAFEKYGNVPINMYTGTLDLKIPIYSIQTKDGRSIDTFISYDSSGFIPHKKNNNAGYNWTLLAGGKITRNVNSTADEYIGDVGFGTSPFGNPNNSHGFLHGVRIKPYSNSDVYNLYSGAGTYTPSRFWLGDKANGYEGEPDDFSFNILGLKGTFMIGNDGKVKVQSNDPNIIVDLSGITTFSHTQYLCIPPKQEIKITDGEGNIYIFGGDFSKYEISYSRGNPYGGNKEGFKGFPTINAYSISKIILAKTKEEISFNYLEAPEYSGINIFCDVMTSPQENYIKNNPLLFELGSFTSTGSRIYDFKNCPGGPSLCSSSSSSGPDGGDTYTLLKKSVLSSISYGKDSLKINYKDLGYAISHHNINNKLMTNETVIDNIELYYNTEKIKSTSFLYSDFGGINKRTFLTGIKKDGENNEYKLEYSNTNNLPTYYTKGIDHWGFWNGKDSNATLNPIDTYNATTGDYTLNNTFRDPAPIKYNIGLLSKITYPTKGYTIFDYEVPNYGKRMERNSASQFLPTLVNVNGIVGGARLAKKTDYLENNSIAKTTRYKYTTSLNGTDSSGILMNWPRYIYYFEFKNPGNWYEKLMITSSSNVQKNTMDGYNIAYSKVFEIEEGNGYTEYDFYSSLDTPDVLQPDAGNLRNYIALDDQTIPINLYKNYRNLYGIDRSIIRGQLKNKIVYDNSSTKKYEKNITYTDIIDFIPSTSKDNNNYVTVNHLSGAWVQGYRKFFNPNFTKTTVIKEFNGTMNSQIDYNYSPLHFNLQNEVIKNSKGETITTEYQYPSDLVGQEDYMEELTDDNRIAEPVVVKQNVGGTYISETHNQYNLFNGIIQKSAVHQKKGSGINTAVPTDRKITYNSYDKQGNLTQYTLENGIPVSIIWGYNGQYPIAKIEGTAYNQISIDFIKELQNLSNQDNDRCYGLDGSCKESNLRKRLNEFRSNGLFTNSMVSVYTYDPLVGVTSIMQPNGQTEYYNYDSSNRLQSIVNDKKEVLKTFEYNYRQP